MAGVSTPVILTTFDILRGERMEKVWFNFALTPITSEAGDAIGVFCAITENTTQVLAQESVARENERLERAAALNAADRDRLWALSTDIMLVADYQSQILAVNPAWQTLLGWPATESIGTEFLRLVHPDDLAATLAEIDNLERGITTLRFENRYRHADGAYRHISWTAVPGDGAIHAVGRDITSETELTTQLAQKLKHFCSHKRWRPWGSLQEVSRTISTICWPVSRAVFKLPES